MLLAAGSSLGHMLLEEDKCLGKTSWWVERIAPFALAIANGYNFIVIFLKEAEQTSLSVI